ncbi:ABC transporter family protein [Tritrichomonas foetus]|uniref:ABC transporter family protein n=1 Tax=Tritrichomonas foetus TaxID=1144522 RepID=A0A1J4KNP1_9EUKA|nr:ABC transporter family protein [Tritrichomonas foetus]|eukprot:OHT12887.1 ABC transporter family protein [Tritrichomonas foetus]
MAIVTACVVPGILKNAALKFRHVSSSMTIAEETLSAIRTVKGCNREDIERDRFMKDTIGSAKAEKRIGIYILIMILCIQLVIWGFTILILWYGATEVDKGKLEVGDLFSVFGFSMFGCMGIIALQGSMQGEQKAIASGARILKLSQHVPTIPFEGGKIIENFKGHIEFKNVSFKYPTRDVYVLRNVSFEIKPGQMGALVGHSGSGKSTSVQLLERYYDAEEGLVLLDGEDIRTLDPRWLHHVIGLVQQEPALFQMSIKENIKYGAPDATDEEVLAAAEIASAKKFVDKLDHGFDQQVGDRGSALSGGQRQRIAIARAVIKNPVILITDEATSALDAASEKKVQKALDKVMEGRTAVVVAHRLSTIRNANVIYVFDSGEIKEIGNHDSLVKLGGFYYNLVKRQMSQQEDIKAKSQIPPKTENKPKKVEEETSSSSSSSSTEETTTKQETTEEVSDASSTSSDSS